MGNEAKTKCSQSFEEWLEERKTYVGGSEIGKILGVSRWGCPLSVFNGKTGVEKDFDDNEKPEFRRGRRLEGIAAEYYEQKTGREVRYTTTAKVPGKPHLAVNMDRLVRKEKGGEWGYLELKVVGRFSFTKIKKEGIADDWILQVQYGCAVTGKTWGSYGIYCPETDDLLHFDVEADKALGEELLEKTDDFWNFHIECGVAPDPLPDGSQQCEGCVYSVKCHSRIVEAAPKEEILRPDLEALVAQFAVAKGMGKESDDAVETIRAELLEAVGSKPGNYRCGKYLLPITQTSSKRFSGDLLKKKDPALYESLRVESVSTTVKSPKEV